MATQIPYFIQFAHPDYKRPYVSTNYGKGTTLEEIRLEIESHIYNYIIDYYGSEKLLSGEIKSYEDIRNMIYCEFYMDNLPINVMVFKDNKWSFFDIDYEDLLKRFHEKELKKNSHEVTANTIFEQIDEEIYDRIIGVLDELDIECESNDKLQEIVGKYITENPNPTAEELKTFISENIVKKIN